jgi:hypothetical protein
MSTTGVNLLPSHAPTASPHWPLMVTLLLYDTWSKAMEKLLKQTQAELSAASGSAAMQHT